MKFLSKTNLTKTFLALAVVFATSCATEQVEDPSTDENLDVVNQGEKNPQVPIAGHTYLIKNVNSGKYLEVARHSEKNGGNIRQWKKTGADNQRWKLLKTPKGYLRILNVRSGLALDVSRYASWNGANIHQWKYHGGLNQKWQVYRYKPGEGTNQYYIRSKKPDGKVLEIGAWSKKNGGNAQQWTYTASKNQRWMFYGSD